MTTKKYTVRILDNFHFMDKEAEYNSGEFDTYEEAVVRCKEILDDFLESAYTAGDTPDRLYSTYLQYGELPLIWGKDLGDFNSNEYVRMRCIEIVHQRQRLDNATVNSKTTKRSFLIKPRPDETKEEFKARLRKLY